MDVCCLNAIYDAIFFRLSRLFSDFLYRVKAFLYALWRISESAQFISVPWGGGGSPSVLTKALAGGKPRSGGGFRASGYGGPSCCDGRGCALRRGVWLLVRGVKMANAAADACHDTGALCAAACRFGNSGLSIGRFRRPRAILYGYFPQG